MSTKIIPTDILAQFQSYLLQEEKSKITIDKYLRDAGKFIAYIGEQAVSKEQVIGFKNGLIEGGYALRSVNSILASVNKLLLFLGWGELKAKSLRQQRQIYCQEDKELTKEEYLRLLGAAEGKPQLHLIMQTICSTGIRVSELRFFTVASVCQGEIEIRCKNKTRTILVPGKLRKKLLAFAQKNKISQGPIFLTKSGKPMSRTSIWGQMKRLCDKAGVKHTKVFPHNLRKLFARTFYTMEKDIAKLADILGHSSINTTRIYIISTGKEHRRKIERLGLLI